MHELFLTTKAHFDAAHSLEGYDGKCANVHGHRWTVEVTIGPLDPKKLDDCGISIDFKEIKDVLDIFVGKLDHRYLNDIIPKPPSAEFLAIACIKFMAQRLAGTPVSEVKVYESPESCAIVRAAS